MHSIAKQILPTKPDKAEKVFEIRDLTGKVHETRESYWAALIRGYALLKCGGFTVEERK